MSDTDEASEPHAIGPSDDVHVWSIAVAIMTFDVDGGGALAFRHTSGQTATLSAEDNLNGRMRLVDERSGEVSAYDSIDALVRDGWSLSETIAPPIITGLRSGGG